MTVKLVLKRCRSINAAKRLLPKVRAIYPNRKIIIVADGLYSNGPFINLVKELSMDYLLVAQHNDHVKLVNEFVARRIAGKTEEYESIEPNMTQGFCWSNDFPLNASHPHLRVNVLNFWEVKHKDDKEKESNWTWITNLELKHSTVIPVMRAGRSRWKRCPELVEGVENETFASTGSAQAIHLKIKTITWSTTTGMAINTCFDRLSTSIQCAGHPDDFNVFSGPNSAVKMCFISSCQKPLFFNDYAVV